MTDFTRDEAITIINLIGDNPDYNNEGTMSVLTKISKSWPGLLGDYPKHAKAVTEYVTKAAQTRQAATKQVATILDDIKAKFEEAKKIATKAKIGFDFYLGDESLSFSPDNGWYSSNC